MPPRIRAHPLIRQAARRLPRPPAVHVHEPLPPVPTVPTVPARDSGLPVAGLTFAPISGGGGGPPSTSHSWMAQEGPLINAQAAIAWAGIQLHNAGYFSRRQTGETYIQLSKISHV